MAVRCWGLIGGLLFANVAMAQPTDSIKVARLLEAAKTLPADSSRALFFAERFIGMSYVAGTLDNRNPDENLVVCLDRLDCTTFVETVAALVLCDKQHSSSYASFKKNLTTVRYRNGERNGYLSRLHYFSDWIADNERKGIVREYTRTISGYTWPVTLNFMSRHPDSYPALKNAPELVEQLKQMEASWHSYTMPYIPKGWLNRQPEELPIVNGSILALTTTIDGLDVTHVGFACWIGGELHLLHASSQKGKVILDPLTLYEYQKNKKTHTGVRVIAIL